MLQFLIGHTVTGRHLYESYDSRPYANQGAPFLALNRITNRGPDKRSWDRDV